MPGIGLEVGFVVVWCSGVAQAGPGQDVGGIRRKRQQAVAPRKTRLRPSTSTSVKPPLQTNLNLPPYWVGYSK